MAAADLNLLQGTLDVLVLKALVFGPRHGYAVASWIRDSKRDCSSSGQNHSYLHTELTMNSLTTRGARANWLKNSMSQT